MTHYPTEVLNRRKKNLFKETLANGLIPFDGACKRARDKWYSEARFWVSSFAEGRGGVHEHLFKLLNVTKYLVLFILDHFLPLNQL